jgi:hypothetical protein
MLIPSWLPACVPALLAPGWLLADCPAGSPTRFATNKKAPLQPQSAAALNARRMSIGQNLLRQSLGKQQQQQQQQRGVTMSPGDLSGGCE